MNKTYRGTKAMIRPYVLDGLSNNDIMVKFPDVLPHNIRNPARLIRLEAKMKTPRDSHSLRIPSGTYASLSAEAKKRGMINPSELARKLLGIIARDNMYDSVIDD
jgi:hypothetical protein